MRHRFRTTQWLPYTVEFVFAFFANPANLPKLLPDWQQARIDEIELYPADHNRPEGSDGLVAAGRGTRLTLSFRPTPLAPVRVSWVALIEDFHWNERFCDRQLEGPFRYWRQCHRVQEWQSETTGEHGTLLIDTIEYELPFRRLERLANRLAVKRMLTTVFAHRHSRTEQLLRELSEGAESPE
ncbi:MAG TPA: SRPBCC family protein [Acidobacteriaceae bacterium]|nr:SRPBCC family protein [Acidobacteriaceae bacterium]